MTLMFGLKFSLVLGGWAVDLQKIEVMAGFQVTRAPGTAPSQKPWSFPHSAAAAHRSPQTTRVRGGPVNPHSFHWRRPVHRAPDNLDLEDHPS